MPHILSVGTSCVVMLMSFVYSCVPTGVGVEHFSCCGNTIFSSIVESPGSMVVSHARFVARSNPVIPALFGRGISPKEVSFTNTSASM